MKYTILAENAVGGLVGDQDGAVHEFEAHYMGTLPDESLNVYMPVTAQYMADDPEAFPPFTDYNSQRFGLTVRAGFDATARLWHVRI